MSKLKRKRLVTGNIGNKFVIKKPDNTLLRDVMLIPCDLNNDSVYESMFIVAFDNISNALEYLKFYGLSVTDVIQYNESATINTHVGRFMISPLDNTINLKYYISIEMEE